MSKFNASTLSTIMSNAAGRLNAIYEDDSRFAKLTQLIGLGRGFNDSLPDDGRLVIPENAKIGFARADGEKVTTADTKGVYLFVRAIYLPDKANIDDPQARVVDVPIGAFYQMGLQSQPKLDGDTIVYPELSGKELLLQQLEALNDPDMMAFAIQFLHRGITDHTRAEMLRDHVWTFSSDNTVWVRPFGKKKDDCAPKDYTKKKVRLLIACEDIELEK